MASSQITKTPNTAIAHDDKELTDLVQNLVMEEYQPPSGLMFESNEKYAWLREAGSRLWLDTGDAQAAEKVWSRELDALTTNNTLVNQVVQTGTMDGLITYAAREIRKAYPQSTDLDVIIEIGFLVNAKLALSLVQKFGAHVSVELHPAVAFNTNHTLGFARRYYAINSEFFYVKAPITPEGFVAVRKASSEGIPVNFTLGFSARQNYLAVRFSNPSYVNIFLGRLNSLVDMNSLGDPRNVGEKVALASDEMAKTLRASTSSKTQQIAASISSGEQIMTLAGVDVLTMPPKHAAEYLAMDITKDQVQRHNWRDLPVNLQAKGPVDPSSFQALWEIDEKFISFVDEAVRQGDSINGSDLVDLSNQYGVNLFHNWTPDERQRLRDQGKIPQTDEWPGIPLDDLMSMAALEFFGTAQVELDERIRGLIASAS